MNSSRQLEWCHGALENAVAWAVAWAKPCDSIYSMISMQDLEALQHAFSKLERELELNKQQACLMLCKNNFKKPQSQVVKIRPL